MIELLNTFTGTNSRLLLQFMILNNLTALDANKASSPGWFSAVVTPDGRESSKSLEGVVAQGVETVASPVGL
jgi:hypothetical protein